MDEDFCTEAVQVYFRGRKLVIRSPPTTTPTEAQVVCRERFAAAARRARGRRRTGSVPPAAEEVQKDLAGFRTDPSSRRPRRRRKWEDILSFSLGRL